jgi:hypothetical protein
MSNLGDISITSNVKFMRFLSIFSSERSKCSGSVNSDPCSMIGAAAYLYFDSRELEVGYFLLVDLEELQLLHQLFGQLRRGQLV